MSDYKEISKWLNYDPGSGILTWRKSATNRTKVGGVAGGVDCQGYRNVRVNGTLYRSHRVAWLLYYGEWPSGIIDHRNTTKADNRIDNLRDVTQLENQTNRSGPNKNNTSGFLGVRWYKAGSKWQAYIRTMGKRIHLGYFDDKDDAIAARRDAEIEFGFFAGDMS